MLLAIDCGNTNVVFSLFDGEANKGEWRIETKHGRTADEYAAWFSHLLTLDNRIAFRCYRCHHRLCGACDN